MRIQELKVTGYRCLANYSVTFTPGINVLIGRNGAGKSTLLHAIVKALSFIFASNRSLGDDFISAGNNTLNVHGFKTGDFSYSPRTGQYAGAADISALAFYRGAALEWSMYQRNTNGSSLNYSKYADAFRIFTDIALHGNESWPLLAYYSDSYPHVNNRIPKTTADMLLDGRVPRNMGYYKWDDESACTGLWETRLCYTLVKQDALYRRWNAVRESARKAAEEGNDEEYRSFSAQEEDIESQLAPLAYESDYILTMLNEFLSKLPLVEAEGYLISALFPVNDSVMKRIMLMFRNGESALFGDLPAGYRRLLSIVFDLAYRTFFLNSRPQDTTGIAVIDEIDLHLHPSLQQHALQALRDTFPNLQFIVSTHSGLVLSGLDGNTLMRDETNDKRTMRANQVLIMNLGTSEPEIAPNMKGLDYNSIVRDFMDSPTQDTEIKMWMDQYLAYLSLGMEQEAGTIRHRLTEALGEESTALRDIDAKATAIRNNGDRR